MVAQRLNYRGEQIRRRLMVFGVHGSAQFSSHRWSPSEIAQSFRNAEGNTMVASPWAGYTDKTDEMPLVGYATLLAAYGGIFSALFGNLLSRSDVTNPGPADVVLVGIA